MLGDELVGRTPEKSQTLPHLTIIESSGLEDKHVCRFPHCQRAAGRVPGTHTRVSVNELLESHLAWENETCVSTDFLHMISKGRPAFGKDPSQNFLTASLFCPKGKPTRTALFVGIHHPAGARPQALAGQAKQVVLCFSQGTPHLAGRRVWDGLP